jgi:hypothetical protein
VCKAILALSIGCGLASLAVAQTIPAASPSLELPSANTRPAGATKPAATRPATVLGLNDLCPVYLRGTPLRQAFAELADRLGVRYILDASIPAATLDEPVRMTALHLTGQQAFRWLARIGGVSAVLVDGVFLVAPEERLPAMWRATGTGTPSQRASEETRWARVNSRRVNVDWIDAPLAGVAQDTAELFGVDLLYHPALLAEPRLLYLKETEVNLDRLREVLGRQLNARTDLYDGALWVSPQGETVHWLSATGGTPEAVASQPESFSTPPQDMWVAVDASVTSWAALAETISAAAGIPCGVDGAEGAAYPGIQAAGSVAEVLDGLRMLGLVVWNVAPEGPSSGPRIKIKVREKG